MFWPNSCGVLRLRRDDYVCIIEGQRLSHLRLCSTFVGIRPHPIAAFYKGTLAEVLKLASHYSEDYYSDDARVQPGISRSSQRASTPRSSGPRTGASDRYSQRRPAPQPARRPSPGDRRPPARKPPRRRRRGGGRAFVLLAVLAVILVAVVLLALKPGSEIPQPIVTPASTDPVVTVTLAPSTDDGDSDATQTATEPPAQYTSISQMLGDTSYQVEGLAADQMVHVDDLSIKEGLSEDWLNVLLLGTDERTLQESARTDAMMICSINTRTGQVKLTSIMRDLAVEFTDIGDYNGTYRINAANYFGGPSYAMKTINRLFDMNIQYYVMINFFGFGKIAQQLGGVEVDISEAEMNKINEDIVKQFKMAYKAGVTDFDPEQRYLEEYGENIHLNGNQTLAYARIRHLEGGDYMRTTRQQIVLKKLLEKAKKMGIIDLTVLAGQMFEQVKTNMSLEDIFTVAAIVLNNGLDDVDTLRLPIAKTYKEEVRNEEGMLYDCDFATNAVKLYNFIYE